MIIPVTSHGESSLPRPSFSCCGLLSSLAQKVSACAHYIWEKITALFSYLFCCTQPRQEVLREITPLPSSVHSDLPSSPPVSDLSSPLSPLLLMNQKTYTPEELDQYLPYEILPELDVRTIVKVTDTTYPGDHCNPQLIDYRDVVDLVRDCVTHNDRNGLRTVVQVLLMGPWRSHERCSTADLNVSLLSYLLYDPAADLLDMGRLILYAFKNWRQAYRPPLYYPTHMPDSHADYGSYLHNLHAEKVTIHHGGCLSVVEKFLKGHIQGYGLERGELGFQVLVDAEVENIHIYTRRALDRFDIPVKLTAQIDPKHLLPAQDHEAGLPARSVPFLENVQVTVLPIEFNAPCSIYAQRVLLEQANREWNGDVALANRIQKSGERKQNREIDYSLLPFLNEEKNGTRSLRDELRTKLEQLRQHAPGYFKVVRPQPVWREAPTSTEEEKT